MKTFLEHIDFGLYEGKHVPLERPMVDVTEEEDKELIAGMAAMGEGGEMQVKIPSLDKMVDIDSLTAEQIDELKVVGMSDSDIYAQQLTVS